MRWLRSVFLAIFAVVLAVAAPTAARASATPTTSVACPAYIYASTAHRSLSAADRTAPAMGDAVSVRERIADTSCDLPGSLPVFVAADTADRAADAATSCLNSFTGDTPVTMADGTQEPIKDIKVGDNVLTTDPQTGVTKAEPVVALIRHSGDHAMVLVTLADGSVLDATAGHKIWDATQHTFVDASGLHVGDKIETDTGALITVAGLTGYSADLTAYNLQIDEIHTYYAGTTPVLVHNSYDEFYETFGAFRVPALSVASSYWDALSYKPSDDATGALLFAADVLCVAGSSGSWGIWGERQIGVAVVHTDGSDLSWRHGSNPFVSPAAALRDFVEPNFNLEPLPDDFREAFLRGFQSADGAGAT